MIEPRQCEKSTPLPKKFQEHAVIGIKNGLQTIDYSPTSIEGTTSFSNDNFLQIQEQKKRTQKEKQIQVKEKLCQKMLVQEFLIKFKTINASTSSTRKV